MKHKSSSSKAKRDAAKKAAPAALAVTEVRPTLEDVVPAVADPQLETGGARAPDAPTPRSRPPTRPSMPERPPPSTDATPAQPEAVPATDAPPAGDDGGTAARRSIRPPDG